MDTIVYLKRQFQFRDSVPQN